MSCLSGNGSAQKKQRLSRNASPNHEAAQHHPGSSGSSSSNHDSPYGAHKAYQTSPPQSATNGMPSSHKSNNSSSLYVNGYASPPKQTNGGIFANGNAATSMPRGNIGMSQFPAGNTVTSYDMCSFCFDLLIHKLMPDQLPRVPPPTFTNSNQSFPLFVTWKSAASSESKPSLRGCIGTFSETKLHKGLHDYALSSALKDSRFNPISAEEIPKLIVSVSILLQFEPASSWDDWTIGVHGIRIEIDTERGQKRTATYLPEVASEQRWTKKQTIDSLLQKSGYSGRINSEVRNRIRLTRYKSEKASLPYHEYKARKGASCANGSIMSNNDDHYMCNGNSVSSSSRF